MAISMFIGTKTDYVQVVVLQPRYHAMMEAMGWVKHDKDLPDELPKEPEAPICEPKSHELAIMSLETKDDVESYVKLHFQVDIDKRGSLDTVKEKAMGVVNESRSAD